MYRKKIARPCDFGPDHYTGRRKSDCCGETRDAGEARL
jgi:hypothetical protein